MNVERKLPAKDRPPRSFYAKVSSKGQVTIPAAVRSLLGVGEGDRIAFEPLGDGRLRIVRAEDSFETLRGIVKVDPSLWVEDIVEAVDRARAAMGRDGVERP